MKPKQKKSQYNDRERKPKENQKKVKRVKIKVRDFR